MSSSFNRIDSSTLPIGSSLDDVRTAGFYDVVNPVGLATGTYHVVVVESGNSTPGALNLKQIAYTFENTNMYSRRFDGASWGSWASMGGGGSASPSGMDAALGYKSWKGSASVYNVIDYGADPTWVADSTVAIQAALDAAKNAGGGVVYVPKGTYKITYQGSAALGGVRIGDNTMLVGEGMGLSVLKLANIGNNDIAGVVRTYSGVENTNIAIRDLTVDGNKSAQTGWANVIVMYFGVTPDDRVHSDKDIWCINVEARNGRNGTTGTSNPSRGYGFDPHEVVDRFHAINCVAHDNERDGFVLDGVINFKLLGCRSYNNGRYGINLITMSFNGIVEGCHVHNNGANGIMVQGDSYNMVIANNYVADNVEQGIRVRRGGGVKISGLPAVVNTFCKIHGNLILRNGKAGVNLTGSCYNTVSDNTLINNGQLTDLTYFDVSLDEDDGDTDVFTGANYNVVRDNYALVDGTLSNRTKSAYREDLTGAAPSGNFYMWNISKGHTQGRYATISTDSRVYDNGRTFYNILDFGAVANDGTDQYAAINSAITTVTAAGGGVVYAPAGTYDIIPSDTASQGGISVPSNVTLLGDGIGKTIFRLKSGSNSATGASGFVCNASGAANVNTSFVGFTIDCNKAGQTGTLASVGGLYLGSAADTNNSVVDVEIKNAYNGTDTAGYGLRITGAGSTGHRLLNVQSHDNDRDGLYLDGCTGVRVLNAKLYSNGRHGALVDGGANDVSFNFCDAYSNATNNYLVQGDSYDVRVRGGSNKSAGNEGFRVRRGTTVVDTYVSILDMIHANNQRDGVKISGACRNRVMNCLFKDNGQAANNVYSDVILLLDTTVTTGLAQKNQVYNNTLLATATNKTKYGINEVSTLDADYNNYRFNYTEGQVTLGYNLFGVNSVKIEGAGGTPVGTNTSFQFNDAGAFAGARGLLYDKTNDRARLINPLEIPTGEAPSPADSTVFLFAKEHGTKFARPAYVTPAGRIEEVGDTKFGKNWWRIEAQASGANWTVQGWSLAALSTTGTAAGATVTASTRLTALRRQSITSAATTNSTAGCVPNSVNVLTRGAVANTGGFVCSTVFGVVTRSTNSRAFFGLRNTTTVIASSAFTGITNMVGVGWDVGDANLSIFTNDSTGDPTKVSLGASFPVSDNTLYELRLACKPNDTNLYYLVRDLTNDIETSGVLTTDLPANNVWIAPQWGLYNGTDAVAVRFDLANFFALGDI